MSVILPNPVTILLSDFSGNTLPSAYFGGELHYTFTDSPLSRVAKGRIKHTDKSFVLWSGHDYDLIGDYTQSDVENKINSLVSGNAAEFISTLFTGVNASGINDIVLN